jgi:hypothetical protein
MLTVRKMSNPFDYLNAITYDKKDLMTDTDNDKVAESDYQPFLINRGLSQYIDTIMYANMMNQYPNLDKKLQFDYLINIVRKKKRYAKWAKASDNFDLEAVKQYYGLNTQKANDALRVLTEKQLHLIKEKLKTGEP